MKYTFLLALSLINQTFDTRFFRLPVILSPTKLQKFWENSQKLIKNELTS